MHLAGCQDCLTKLNDQKKMLCALDFVLEKENEIELPVNFTKVVVATAESGVSGLRRPQERSKALFVCAVLFLLVILGLGSETESVFKAVWKFGDQFLVVGGFVAHLFYDVAIGIAVIMRSLSHHIVFNSVVSIVLITAFLVVSLLAFSRIITRFNRV